MNLNEIDRGFGADLDSHIASIHESFGLDFPAFERPGHSADRIGNLQAKAQQQIDLRRQTIAMLKREFPQRSNLIAVAEIGAALAEEFDQIYISQLIHHDTYNHTSDGKSRNWTGYNGGSADSLKKKIDVIFTDYAGFLTSNVNTANILTIIRDELVDESDPERLEEIAVRLEEEAYQSYILEKPTIVLSLSNYGTHPDGPSNRMADMFNPDLRVIDPVSLQQQDKYQALVDDLWQMLLANFPEAVGSAKIDFRPAGIIGTGLTWGGAQLESYTAAEALRNGRFVLAQNVLNRKVVAYVKDKFGHLLIYPDEAKIFDYALISFILHELGHQIFGVKRNEVEELATDISCYLLLLTAIAEQNGLVSHLNVHDYIAFIAAESTRMLGSIEKAEILTDGYGVTSIFHLNQLVNSGLLVAENGRFRIDDSPGNLERLLQRLHETHILLSDKKHEDEVLSQIRVAESHPSYAKLRDYAR